MSVQGAQEHIDALSAQVVSLRAEVAAANARLDRVKELAYGEPDLFITADSPPPHTKYIDQSRLRAVLDEGNTP